MVKACFVILLLAIGVHSQQNGQNLDDLIDEIFTKSPPIPGQPGGSTPDSRNPVPPPQPLPQPQPQPVPGGAGVCTGECIPYYLCNNGQINDNGEGLIDIRFGEDAPSECPNYLEVCCGATEKVPDPIVPIRVKNSGCGVRNVNGIGFRITGQKDNEAEYGEFPWMVAILQEDTAQDQLLNVYQCGGALIHPSVVLTAAHCVSTKTPTSLKIRAGEWDTQTRNEIYDHQDRNVVDYVYHPQYYKGGLFNDIALVFLDSPVDMKDDNVGTVCLPPQAYNVDGNRCTASGWGKDVFGKEGRYQVILKRIELPIVSRPQCQQAFRGTRLGQRFNLHASFICAGGEPGRDTCKGDGGSPLVCPIPGTDHRYYQSGIVAWGIGCGEHGVPGAYVDVAGFRDWIDQQMHQRSYDTSFYNYS